MADYNAPANVKHARRKRMSQMKFDTDKYIGLLKCTLKDTREVVVKPCLVFWPPGAEEQARRQRNKEAIEALANYVPPPVIKPCLPGFRLRTPEVIIPPPIIIPDPPQGKCYSSYACNKGD